MSDFAEVRLFAGDNLVSFVLTVILLSFPPDSSERMSGFTKYCLASTCMGGSGVRALIAIGALRRAALVGTMVGRENVGHYLQRNIEAQHMLTISELVSTPRYVQLR